MDTDISPRERPWAPDKSAIEAARAEIFKGIVDQPTLKIVLSPGGNGRPLSDQTIDRYVAAGMPYLEFAGRRLFEPEKVRQWILSHIKDRAPRGRGRPRRVG